MYIQETGHVKAAIIYKYECLVLNLIFQIVFNYPTKRYNCKKYITAKNVSPVLLLYIVTPRAAFDEEQPYCTVSTTHIQLKTHANIRAIK